MLCPRCGRAYSGPGLFLLYSDEHGRRCGGCGGVLAPAPEEPVAEQTSGVLVPAGLEGSDLHRRLSALPGVEVRFCGGGAVRPGVPGVPALAGRSAERRR